VVASQGGTRERGAKRLLSWKKKKSWRGGKKANNGTLGHSANLKEAKLVLAFTDEKKKKKQGEPHFSVCPKKKED